MTKELQRVHNHALIRFDDCYAKTRDERRQALEDRRFCTIAGAQWEGKLEDLYENKAKFEVNKTALAVRRIINDYRANRITVDFKGKNEKAERQANFLDEKYRCDENQSNAEEAYDNAFQEAVKGGFGAWRLTHDLEDENDPDNAYQNIRIEPIYDADQTVFFDVGSKKQDKSDAKYVFLLNSYTKEDYKEEFGSEPSEWKTETRDRNFDWVQDNSVYVAEYYVLEKEKYMVYTYEDKEGNKEHYTDEDFEDDKDLKKKLKIFESKKIGEKEMTRNKVHKYILSGDKVLEDCGIVAGCMLPIVPVYGDYCVVSNIERFMGHVRMAKDPQRLKNMQLSKLAETAALTPVNKPIFTAEQIGPHQAMWTEDNIKNYPFLLVEPIEDANGNMVAQGPLAYTQSPEIPPATAAIMQIVEADMKEIMGDHQSAEQVKSGVSGDAYEQIQTKLDQQSYQYMSNMAKAIEVSGKIYIGMCPDIYGDKGREVDTLDKGGESHVKTLMQEVVKGGETYVENDLSDAKFSVVVDVGPSSSTKKQAAAKSLTAAAQATSDPETISVLNALLMMNLEVEGGAQASEYFRRQLVTKGVFEPTEEDQQRMEEAAQNQQPDATQEYLKSEAEKNRAQAAKTVSEIEENKAQTVKIQAETAEIMAAIERNDLEAVAKIMANRQPTIGENFTL